MIQQLQAQSQHNNLQHLIAAAIQEAFKQFIPATQSTDASSKDVSSQQTANNASSKRPLQDNSIMEMDPDHSHDTSL